jgi:galactonate dehydratase
MKKIAAMAEAHHIMMAPHSGSLGPVAEYAALHLMAAIPNALILERIEDDWEGARTRSCRIRAREWIPARCPMHPASVSISTKRSSRAFPAGRMCRCRLSEQSGSYAQGTHRESVYVQTRLQMARLLSPDTQSEVIEVRRFRWSRHGRLRDA